jgi:hypothetical protein
MVRLVTIVCLFALGASLRVPQKVVKNTTVPEKKAPTVKNVTAAAKNVTKKAHHNVSNTEKLGALFQGLKTLKELRTMFQEDHKAGGASKFANGALSDELAKSDSGIWDTIDTMLTSTMSAQSHLNGKSKEEQKKVMDGLEEDLDAKAGKLNTGLEAATKKQQVLDAEYVLGLLMMHRKDWDMKQQLNATAAFMKDSPILQKLYSHHDSKKPLAAQLAELMDTVKKQNSSAVPSQHPDAKAAAGHVAVRLFLQLATHFESH